VLNGQVVDLQRRVGTVASEPDDVVETVTDALLLNPDSVIHHSDSVIHHPDVVDGKHASVNLATHRTKAHPFVSLLQRSQRKRLLDTCPLSACLQRSSSPTPGIS